MLLMFSILQKLIQSLNENKFWNSSYSNNKKSSSNIKWLNINKNNKLIILSFLGAISRENFRFFEFIFKCDKFAFIYYKLKLELLNIISSKSSILEVINSFIILIPLLWTIDSF